MPDYLAKIFADVNSILESTRGSALNWASEFSIDAPRDRVMSAHKFARHITGRIAAARQTPNIVAYAQEQWGQPSLDFVAKAQEIEAAADAIGDYIEANFPTVLSTLNAAMNAISLTGGQQNALRNQMGPNLDYVLTHRFATGQLESPTIPAAQLAPLVTLMNNLAAAATI